MPYKLKFPACFKNSLFLCTIFQVTSCRRWLNYNLWTVLDIYMRNKNNCFFAPGKTRLRVLRNGRSIIRSHSVPKPVVIVDTREKEPLPIYGNHPNWIAGERRGTLKTGDYTVEGMETLLCLERKSLADIVACAVSDRKRFLKVCSRIAGFKWKAILIEATLEDIKGGFEQFDIPSGVHPNVVCGTLDAIEAKFGIPIIYTSTERDLATERAASWLSKHFTYWWLEQHGHGRVLIDSDQL